jgi:hypothetical protein
MSIQTYKISVCASDSSSIQNDEVGRLSAHGNAAARAVSWSSDPGSHRMLENAESLSGASDSFRVAGLRATC